MDNHWLGPVLMTGIIGALGGMFPVATVTVSISDTLVSHVVFSPSTAQASYALTSGGDTLRNGASAGAWLLNGAAADYEVRATLTSGTFSTGTAGSWLSLASTQAWNVTQNTIGESTCTATFEIRAIATPGTILDTASITLTATVEV